MMGDFEVKLSPEVSWELKFINIYNGISISNNQTDYRNKIRTKLSQKNKFKIEEKYNLKGYQYSILTISSIDYTVQIRAISRISLEYIIYHATLKDPVDTGCPLTFYPHLTNSEAPLVEKNIWENNYQGLLNLVILVWILTHIRWLWSNFKKYGPWLTPTYVLWLITDYKNTLFVVLSVLLVSIVTYLTYVIEHFASRNPQKRKIYVFHALNLFCLVTVPLCFHRLDIISPISGMIGFFIITAFTLKLISYCHFWYDVRRFILNKKRLINNDDQETKNLFQDIREVIDNYPNNITLKKLVAFLIKPILCYQYKYPKSLKIRKKYIALYTVQIILGIFAFVLITVQYTWPIWEKSFIHIERGNIQSLFERILKISIPNVYSWILLFYIFFHCWMNLLAEVTRFADRTFYQDWWNSLYWDEYWRKWNVPTHYWMMRHIYNPLRRRKFNKLLCVGATFFISGVVHEYVVSAALGYCSYWAFLAMFLNFLMSVIQVYIRENPKFAFFKNSQMWNVAFWICFCFIGQPVAILLYFYEYSKKNNITGENSSGVGV